METKKNYNAMYNKKDQKKTTEGKKEKIEVISEQKNTQTESDTKPTPPEAVVVNCLRLNVREQPNKLSNVVCLLEAGDIVLVNDTCDDWVHIYTVSGIDGYVMKEFIKHKK